MVHEQHKFFKNYSLFFFFFKELVGATTFNGLNVAPPLLLWSRESYGSSISSGTPKSANGNSQTLILATLKSTIERVV